MFKNLFNKSNYDKYYKDLVPYIKKDRNQQYIAIILTFGASIFFLIFAVRPTLTTIAKLQKDLADSKLVNEKLTQKVNNLSSLSLQEREIQEDIPLILQAVPVNPDAPNLIAQIQAIANSTSVILTNTTVSPIDLSQNEATSSAAFNFNTSVQGNYEQVNNFLKTLVNMQRVVSVNSISVVRSSDGSQSLQMDLNGTAYYLPE